MAETIVLIGPPAVGKSTVGANLARRLGVPFIDVDQLIEDREQRAISEIFATDGESLFRAMELDATLAALEGGGVIALGGGAVTNATLRAALRGHRVIWLRASVPECACHCANVPSSKSEPGRRSVKRAVPPPATK